LPALSSFFVGQVFAPRLSAAQIPFYVARLTLLAAVPGTAMVFVWSNLYEGGSYLPDRYCVKWEESRNAAASFIVVLRTAALRQ
jgi:hypothetical protein